jgi:subtilase family serine protease
VTFRTYLSLRDQAGAEALAKAVSTPGNAAYGKYLTPAQIKSEFNATDAEVTSVKSWLGNSGFTVGSVPSNNAYVEATGTVAQVEKAFQVNLGQYNVSGVKVRAADKDLTVPSSISSLVSGVIGVDQALKLVKPSSTTGATTKVVAPGAGFRAGKPCSSYYGEKTDTTDPAFNGKQLSYAVCGYTGPQLRKAYGVEDLVNSGVDGRGQTVAIVDAFGSPTAFSDAVTYTKRNDPTHVLKSSQYKEIVAAPTPGSEDASSCDASGWYGEESLDIEAAHSIAPGAKILYVGAADCNSLDASLNTIISGHLSNIISNSWSDNGEDIPASEFNEFNKLSIQAVLQGIGMYFSSGDDGDNHLVNTDGKPTVDFPASSPWVTAVGGTSLGIDSKGNRSVETGWSTGKGILSGNAFPTPKYVYGGGGGVSTLYAQPFYQKGTVPSAISSSSRTLPDISALGDPNTGFLEGITQTFSDGVYYDEYRIGGTSLSAPLTAATVALSDGFQHVKHGFINPALYLFTAHTPGIRDVKPVTGAAVARIDYVNSENATDGIITSVRTLDDESTSIHTTVGYDTITGVGTPNGFWFAALL